MVNGGRKFFTIYHLPFTIYPFAACHFLRLLRKMAA
jgi:hypothetical protein